MSITINGPITLDALPITPTPVWDYSYTRLQHGVANTESVSTVLTGFLSFESMAVLQRGPDYLTSNVISFTGHDYAGQGFRELRSMNYSCTVNSSIYTTSDRFASLSLVSTDSGGNVFVMYNVSGIVVEGTSIGGALSLVVEKYNPALERQWKVVTGSIGTDTIANGYIKLAPDDLGGVIVFSTEYPTTIGGYMIGIGSDGTKQWERNLNWSGYWWDNSTYIIPNLSENKILIVFYYLANPYDNDYPDRVGSILMEVLLKDPIAGEPVGNNVDQIVWQDHRTDKSRQPPFVGQNSVIKDPTGGFLHTPRTSGPATARRRVLGKSIFTKYSSAGEILWSKVLGTLYTNSSTPRSSYLAAPPIITENGDIWCIEWDIEPPAPDPPYYNFPTVLILRKIDKDGNHILSRHIEMLVYYGHPSNYPLFQLSGFMYDGKDIRIMLREDWESGSDTRELVSHLFSVPILGIHLHNGEITHQNDNGNAKITITNRSIENDTWTDYPAGTQGAGVILSEVGWSVSDNIDVVDTTTAGIDALTVPNYDYKTTYSCYRNNRVTNAIGPVRLTRD